MLISFGKMVRKLNIVESPVKKVKKNKRVTEVVNDVKHTVSDDSKNKKKKIDMQGNNAIHGVSIEHGKIGIIDDNAQHKSKPIEVN